MARNQPPRELLNGREEGTVSSKLGTAASLIRKSVAVLIVSKRGMRNRVWCVGLGVESKMRAANHRREAHLLSDRYDGSGEKRTTLATTVQR